MEEAIELINARLVYLDKMLKQNVDSELGITGFGKGFQTAVEFRLRSEISILKEIRSLLD